jgi:hypothetical protein
MLNVSSLSLQAKDQFGHLCEFGIQLIMAPGTVEPSASFIRGSRGSMRLDRPLDCILNGDIEKVGLKKRKSPAGLKTGLNSTTIHLSFDE